MRWVQIVMSRDGVREYGSECEVVRLFLGYDCGRGDGLNSEFVRWLR